LLAANQDSANIAVFRRDSETGMLTPTGGSYEIDFPMFLMFV
jgi:6-phosphogluconolactonase (cycloisomerase 2 family)